MKYFVCMSIHLLGVNLVGSPTKDSCLFWTLEQTIEVPLNKSLEDKIALLKAEAIDWVVEKGKEEGILYRPVQVTVVFNSIVPLPFVDGSSHE